jgi:lipopolysaccharide export system protein LptC
MLGWSPVLLLGSLAAMTYWLNTQVRPAGPAPDGSSRHEPDLISQNFKAVSLGANGQVRQALTAASARHYPDDDSTAFEQATMVFTDPDNPRVDVSADHATLTGDREHVYLHGHAKIVRAAEGGEKPDGPVTVTSEYLEYMPKEDRAVTDKPVTITEPRGMINAIGVELDNKAKTAKFKSHLSGQILPQNNAQ